MFTVQSRIRVRERLEAVGKWAGFEERFDYIRELYGYGERPERGIEFAWLFCLSEFEDKSLFDGVLVWSDIEDLKKSNSYLAHRKRVLERLKNGPSIYTQRDRDRKALASDGVVKSSVRGSRGPYKKRRSKDSVGGGGDVYVGQDKETGAYVEKGLSLTLHRLTEAVKGRSALERENVNWVAANLLVRFCDLDVAGIPSVTALGLLEWAKCHKDDFWKNLYTKLMPTKSQLDDTDAMFDDGREINGLIDVLLKLKSESLFKPSDLGEV